MNLGVDWVYGVTMNISHSTNKITILSVYLPYQSSANDDDFIEKIQFLETICSDPSLGDVIILGDFNANANNSSLFFNRVLDFCNNNSMNCIDYECLLSGSFTYYSEVWHTTGWLDHRLISNNIKSSVCFCSIAYDCMISDHFPIMLEIKCSQIPNVYYAPVRADKIDWTKINDQTLYAYKDICQTKLSNINIPSALLSCIGSNCDHHNHSNYIDSLYENICNILNESSHLVFNLTRDDFKYCKVG